jgi:hypothetical protein
MIMNIDDHLASLTHFMPLERLKEVISAPSAIMIEPVTTVIPSTVVGTDGVALVSLVLLTEHYLCEVRISSRSEFDFIRKSSVKNYRVSSWDHEVKEGEEVKATFQIAQVALLHNLTGFQTGISYAGDQRDAWLKFVVESLPLATTLTAI